MRDLKLRVIQELQSGDKTFAELAKKTGSTQAFLKPVIKGLVLSHRASIKNGNTVHLLRSGIDFGGYSRGEN